MTCKHCHKDSATSYDGLCPDCYRKLTAAAPDLLASLQEMVADLISHAKFGMNESEVAMLKRAEAAIRKAGQ